MLDGCKEMAKQQRMTQTLNTKITDCSFDLNFLSPLSFNVTSTIEFMSATPNKKLTMLRANKDMNLVCFLFSVTLNDNFAIFAFLIFLSLIHSLVKMFC